MPHPSHTKFTAYTLTTRNQQPILQSQNFATQPKTYQLYESYRNFVLNKLPKRFGVGGNIGDLIPPKETLLRDRKLDYWLDDEDMEDDSLSLYWRPKVRFIFVRIPYTEFQPSSSLQPQAFQTTDFLVRMITRGPSNSSVPSLKQRSDSPGNRDDLIDTHMQDSLAGILETSGMISSMSDLSMNPIPEPSLRQNPRTRRKSVSVLPTRRSSDWNDLGIPYRQKSSFSPKNLASEMLMKRSDIWAENRNNRKGMYDKATNSREKDEASLLLIEPDTETFENHGTFFLIFF